MLQLNRGSILKFNWPKTITINNKNDGTEISKYFMVEDDEVDVMNVKEHSQK
jgi:hypothetical protein